MLATAETVKAISTSINTVQAMSLHDGFESYLKCYTANAASQAVHAAASCSGQLY